MSTTLQELHDLLKNNEPDDPGYNGPKLGLSFMNVFVNGKKWLITFTSDKGYVDIVTNVRNGYNFGLILEPGGVLWRAPKATIVTKYSTYDDKWINCD